MGLTEGIDLFKKLSTGKISTQHAPNKFSEKKEALYHQHIHFKLYHNHLRHRYCTSNKASTKHGGCYISGSCAM